ncbi:hypothetical protein J3E74DRAFT_424877 [Bipolaris maydis]|nr:hypothetical protein J3E74DRAFT_424877 [Bipolaris maydis]
MAFVVDKLNQKNAYQIPRPKVCYYYCQDDGSGQVVNILSGLILALLKQLPGLKKTFYEWYKENQTSETLEPATSASKLGEFLELVMATFDRMLFIIIDRLDECDRISRRTLLRLKILLSSRPKEKIIAQLGKTTKISIESSIYRDTIIVRHTVQKQLPYLSETVRELIVESLSRSAQGSAIWTKMTVELIKVRKINALAPMRLFLGNMSLPGHLSELYTTLLSRNSSNDTKNRELAALALKLLAAACRPLSIQELTWAVALAVNHHDINTVTALAESVDHQRVISLIYPFITRVDFTDLRKQFDISTAPNAPRTKRLEEVWKEDIIRYDPTKRSFSEFFINQNCRPGCAIKARFDFNSRLHDPLSIASLYGSDSILYYMLENSDFNADNYLPSTALNAADQILQWGDLSKLRILFFNGKIYHQLQDLQFFQLIIKRWFQSRSRHENWAEAFDLVDSVLDTLVDRQWGNELLCIEVLKTKLWRNSRPISEAILGNHVVALEYLLDGMCLELDHLPTVTQRFCVFWRPACRFSYNRLIFMAIRFSCRILRVN